MSEAYKNLCTLSRELGLLNSTQSIISWDQETHMPPEAGAYRAEQLAYLSGRAHRLMTDPAVGDWIAACEDEGYAEGSEEAVNVREWRWEYDRAVKMPAEFVEEFEKAKSEGTQAWQEARKKDDFPMFEPYLAKLFELARRKADYVGFAQCRYDALLEDYERGATTEEVAALFGDLKKELSEIAKTAAEKTKAVPADLLDGDYPEAQQAAFNGEVAEAMGFDFQAGRIDTAVHPFCTDLGPRDVRLTTRYNLRDFTSSLYGVMHEAGHGLYGQGVGATGDGLPVRNAISLGIHESQSRLWENHVGRSADFWANWHAKALEHFPALKGKSADDLIRAAQRAELSLIRVEADEATYDLHILLRFEIERALIEGDLEVKDLPGFWNERFERDFGIKVPSNAEGCMQDIHWSFGLFGYFPTYTLGNLAAAQLFRSAMNGDGGISEATSKADYAPLLKWLRERVHAPGRRYLPKELVEKATGAPLDAKWHLEHLRNRYCES